MQILDVLSATPIETKSDAFAANTVFQDPAISGWEITPNIDATIPLAEAIAHRVFDDVRKDVHYASPTNTSRASRKILTIAANLLRAS